MRRFGFWIASAALACAMAGCDGGGIKEGAPTEDANAPQTDSFRDQMKQNAGNMASLKKGRPKNAAQTKPAGAQ